MKIYGIVYKVTNIINGKCYIGQTTLSLNERWKNHIYNSNWNDKCYFHKAIKKYGYKNFKTEIISKCFSRKELNKKEIEMIKTNLSYVKENGYNLTYGGEGISGYKHTDKTRKKISESGIGRKRSEESKKRQSITNKNKIFSLEYRKKLSIAQTGKHLKSETKDKLRDIFSKDLWIITDPNGNIFKVKSLRNFCKENNLSRENMSSVAHGRIKKSKGYKCEKIKNIIG